MSLSIVESPLSLNIANMRVGISFNFIICLLGTEYRMGLDLSRLSFFSDYFSQVLFMIFQNSCIGFRSRESAEN